MKCFFFFFNLRKLKKKKLNSGAFVPPATDGTLRLAGRMNRRADSGALSPLEDITEGGWKVKSLPDGVKRGYAV